MPNSEQDEHGSPKAEKGRVAYVVLYAMGVPVGILLVLWLIFGNNLFGPG